MARSAVFVAQQIGQYTLSELADQACVLPGTSTYTGRIILNRFKASGIDLQPAMSTNYLETIHMLVGVGVGWSVLPQTMQAGLEALTVTDLEEPLSRSLGMVTYPDRALSAASRAFQSVLRDYADILLSLLFPILLGLYGAGSDPSTPEPSWPRRSVLREYQRRDRVGLW